VKRGTLSIYLLAFVALAQTSSIAQDAADNIPLSTQLEGLTAESRIAYLRYLLQKQKGDAEIYFQLGVAFHESTEPDSAEHYYKRALSESPDLSKAHVNLGVLYDDKGKAPQALEQFEWAIRANPSDVLALSHAAFMQFQLKRYSKADEYIRRAISLAPDNPQPHFYLAIFFWENGMYREALREWQTVADLDPGGELAASARQYITLLQNSLRGGL
jgi:protein O-GlcNAc transferase